jgi:SAM-dependent methyltransferase
MISPLTQSNACPLCECSLCSVLCKDSVREYFKCPECFLIFVPSHCFLSAKDELLLYQQHQNDVADPEYRKFLSRVFVPLAEKLSPQSSGLDFGCGPGPALAAMFSEAGHQMRVFDLFFARDMSVFQDTYDFIVSTEVFEHLHEPRNELLRLWSCLKPGGWLGVMTKRCKNESRFCQWFYRIDPSHVIFFSDQTFQWVARLLNAELHILSDDVVLMQRKTKPSES